jgi:hypothetical protein
LALVLGLACSASAATIVYDGFDYPAGTLGGQSGGIGWTAAWDGGQTVSTPGMDYPGLPIVGNKVTSTSTASFRMMPTGFSAANRTIWISFLGQNSATPSWCGISPFMSGSEALFIGKPDGSATWGIALYNAQNDSGGATGSKLSTIPVGDKVFFVVRIINGASNGQITAWLNPTLNKEPGVDTAFYDSKTANNVVGRVLFDRIRISGAGQALFYDELRVGDNYMDVSGSIGLGKAADPKPESEATDVHQDAVLSWTAGEFAASHDVYFGASAADVNNASRANPMGILVSQDQATTEFDPEGLLEFGQTYYWRIDEVNAAPDNTIYKGKVWSFTAEPFSYPITGITAKASSSSQATMSPEKTIDGIGLNADDQHSVDGTQMWTGILPAWIQYQFDKVYKLDKLLVWNSNQVIEAFVGFGAKTVKIEYSVDGTTWTELAGVPEFAQAPGLATYTANTTVDFGGVDAKFVKLTITKNWGTIGQAGLSEVRFYAAPILAREPIPAVDAKNVAVGTDLDWRPGRGSTSHKVFIGTDSNSVAASTTPAGTVAVHGFTPSSLNFATKYFWRVDEVGEDGTYAGDVWNFTTEEYAPIDNMESYTDDEGSRIYEAWVDGVTDTVYGGSTVGYMQAPFAEKTAIHGGAQSMPLAYDNSISPYFSEAELTFGTPQNWTLNGATTVSLFYQGSAPAFVQTPSGTILMNGQGSDIWATSDQFRFAYKTLTGNGTIVARVLSVYNTPGNDGWSKAGVMIRQSTEPGSTHAFTAKTSSSGNGASFQRRLVAAGDSTNNDATAAVAAPYWVKVDRNGDKFSSYISPDGVTWTQLGEAQTIVMTGPVMIGLAVCSHNASAATSAEFSDVKITGNVAAGDWQMAEVGVTQPMGNSVEGLYLTVKDSAGKTKTLQCSDTIATAQAGWKQWKIALSDLTAAGVKASAIKSIVVGVGNKAAPTKGGTGKIYIDDIGYGVPLP